MNFRKMNKSGGFTLLEVIVALGIVSVGILGVSSALSWQANTIAEAEKRTIALWIAANRLDTLRINLVPPTLGEETGSEEMAGHPWYYVQRTEETSDPLLYRISIQVFRDRNATDEAASLIGYLLKK